MLEPNVRLVVSRTLLMLRVLPLSHYVVSE